MCNCKQGWPTTSMMVAMCKALPKARDAAGDIDLGFLARALLAAAPSCECKKGCGGPVAIVKEGRLCQRIEWLSDEHAANTPAGAKLYLSPDAGKDDDLATIAYMAGHADGKAAGGDDAPWLTEAHMLCTDHGIQQGHINDRIKALRDKLDAGKDARDVALDTLVAELDAAIDAAIAAEEAKKVPAPVGHVLAPPDEPCPECFVRGCNGECMGE